MAKNWLEEAQAITGGERRRDYGSPLVNFLRIAVRWSNWLEHRVTPVDVAMMMVDVKIAREINTHKEDNYVDILGYVACVQSMDRDMKEMGYKEGVEYFDMLDVPEMYELLEKARRFEFSQSVIRHFSQKGMANDK